MVIGEDAADPRGGQEHGLGPRIGDPGLDVGLAAKVEPVAIDRDDLAGFALEAPDQGRADHAAVTGDPDPFAGQIVGSHRHCGAFS